MIRKKLVGLAPCSRLRGGASTLLAAFLVAFMVSLPAMEPEKRTEVRIDHGEPGGLLVETYERVATVVDLDRERRIVTIVGQDGQKSIFKAGPEVRNFSQIQRGDRLKVELTRQYLSFVRPRDAPLPKGEDLQVSLAPQGSRPRLLVMSTSQFTGTIQSINLLRRTATVRFPDGRRQVFQVRPDVSMTRHRIGEQVVFRTTESVAVKVTRQP
ncbi:MAG: hypothetical protein CJBNEKGG_02743 [Prosthecobacter sp.]|nr:hypothetical protein [Prosthecobacter sp.]